jgi:hypothetical protein
MVTVILLLPFSVFYWQVPFIGNHTLGNDYLPVCQNQLELQYSLKHGTFPLFVPGFAGGQPSAALTVAQMFHPISHLASALPGYWNGDALQWNTFWRLISLGLAHLGLFILLCRLRLNRILSFIISFITVYNLRMLDLFRYGSPLENYTGLLFLCTAMAFYYIKPTRFIGPVSIIGATYLLICGGHPQMMYYGLLSAAIAAAAIPFVLSKISNEIEVNRRRFIKYITRVGASFAAGLLLASAYTIPFYFDFIKENAGRVGQPYQWSILFSDTVGGALNSFFIPLHSDVHGAFGSSSLIILIAFIPLLYTVRKKVPISIIVLWAATVLIFLCSLGGATPVHHFFWKHFPLANTFRVPGRISMLFPFLFLLILAWFFRPTGERDAAGPGKSSISPYLLPALIAVPLFLLYHKVLVNYLPEPRLHIPMQFRHYPQWVDPLIFWMGLLTLILVVLYSFQKTQFRTKRRAAIGILLAAAVVLQVTVEIRYGTWISDRHPQPTLAQLNSQKKTNLTSRVAFDFGLESRSIITQRKHSILEPFLAKFYRNYRMVPDQDRVYRILKSRNVTRMIAVEGIPEKFPQSGNDRYTSGLDRVVLEESTFNRLQFTADIKVPGFFSLSYPFSDKWHAAVDGENTRIYRANGYMQAVYLNPGRHVIEFRYWSRASFIGMLISCLTLFFTGLYFACFTFEKKLKWRVLAAVVTLFISSGLLFSWYGSIYSGDNLGTEYTWTPDDFPDPNNLAYAKRTTMNNYPLMNYAGLGVDGDKSGPSFSTRNKRQGWWQVDLGSPKPVGEIVIYDNRCQSRKNLPLMILGSIDGKTFKLLKKVEERGKSQPWHIPIQSELTRFVRLQSSPDRPLSFEEIEIYPILDPKI